MQRVSRAVLARKDGQIRAYAAEEQYAPGDAAACAVWGQDSRLLPAPAAQALSTATTLGSSSGANRATCDTRTHQLGPLGDLAPALPSSFAHSCDTG